MTPHNYTTSMPRHIMPSYAQPQAMPTSGLDKLERLQNIDTGEQQGEQGNLLGLTHMLSSLYGIQHDQHSQAREDALLPEQLRGLRNKNTAEEFSQQWAQPEAEQGYRVKEAQIEHLQHPGKYDLPDLHSLLTMQQMGLIKPEDIMRTLPDEGPYAGMKQSYTTRFDQQTAANNAEKNEREHPPIVQPPSNVKIPPQYLADPKIQSALRDIPQQQAETDPGLIQARRAAMLQSHPVAQFVHDMIHPSELGPGAFGGIGDSSRDWMGRLKSSAPQYTNQ